MSRSARRRGLGPLPHRAGGAGGAGPARPGRPGGPQRCVCVRAVGGGRPGGVVQERGPDPPH